MITLSDKFQRDIISNVYTIVPLIIINKENNPIYISTNKQSFELEDGSSVFWKDYDLNISNISESINLETRAFKTNNVNFSLTNYTIEEKRLSDAIAEFALINKYVDIYYKTQSCTSLNDCALVYRGIIKTIKHDSKKINFTLEDLTENKLDIELSLIHISEPTRPY